MSDKCDLCLLGLIILSSLLSGTSGVDDAHVFISSGQNVRLSCNNALSDCTSTTWTYYNRFRHSAAVELINGGIKRKDTERHESLSLGSDCSLIINNVTIQDYGSYTCQQYENGQKQGPHAYVSLHVLHVSVSPSSSSSSSSQTEISPGRSVTLSCQLYSYPGVSCDYWVRSEDIELLWVNQAGVDLQTDSRYQISAPDHCIITLTTTLLNEDHNREWRCGVTHRKQLKASVTHTVTYSGTSGVDEAHVFISSGQNVRLPCNNALSDCTSTTWAHYNRFRHSVVELIKGGIKEKDTERHESLGSDCSLNINNVTIQDYGFYTCQQYVNGQQQGTDARVFLHVLHVSASSSSSSSSSSQSEISPGRSVTLFCQLYSDYGFPCDYWVRSEDIELLWVNQAGVDLQTDSRYQISAPGHCNRTLTTTLLNEDHNREWRCEVTQGNQLKTSVTHTVKSSAQDDTRTPDTNSDDRSTTNTHVTKVAVISVTAVAAVAVFLLAVLWLMCRKRADNKGGPVDSAVRDEDEHKGTYETIDMSIPPAARANELTDDHVTYSEVTSSNKKPVKSLDDHNDTVTYAAIR